MRCPSVKNESTRDYSRDKWWELRKTSTNLLTIHLGRRERETGSDV
jgi:hypothetical protein